MIPTFDSELRGCNQAGASGPPFANLPEQSPLAHWVPWRWHSLGGTGWCYNHDWDELLPCRDLDLQPDWNGIARSDPAAAASTSWRLLLALTVAAALSVYNAFRDWERRSLLTPAAPSALHWCFSRHALPWAWDSRARQSACASLLGVVIAFCWSDLVSPASATG